MGYRRFGVSKYLLQKEREDSVAKSLNEPSNQKGSVSLIVLALGVGLFGTALVVQATDNQHNTSLPLLRSSDSVERTDDAPKTHHTEVKSETKTTFEQHTTNTDLTINGEKIPIPQGGSYHKEFQSNDSTTTVDVENKSNGSGHSSSRLHIEVE